MEWIDINDDIPKTPHKHGRIYCSDKVLVWTDDGCKISQYSKHYEETHNGLKFIKGLWMDSFKITHWMELPNQPKQSKMREEFVKLFEEKIGQLTFLDREKVINLMEISYDMGKKDTFSRYGQLKEAFEDLLEMWGDFGKYNTSRNHMEEDWKKQAGLL